MWYIVEYLIADMFSFLVVFDRGKTKELIIFVHHDWKLKNHRYINIIFINYTCTRTLYYILPLFVTWVRLILGISIDPYIAYILHLLLIFYSTGYTRGTQWGIRPPTHPLAINGRKYIIERPQTFLATGTPPIFTVEPTQVNTGHIFDDPDQIPMCVTWPSRNDGDIPHTVPPTRRPPL